LLANQHVDPLFAFSKRQLEDIKKILVERRQLLQELMPWENINFGLDEQWVRFYPYEKNVMPGSTHDLEVIIYNHFKSEATFSLELNLPSGYNADAVSSIVTVSPGAEGKQIFNVNVPYNAEQGVQLITANVRVKDWELKEWCEAILVITPEK
jgi:hypothetical protein